MQQSYESLRHSIWECKYHVVFIPKCRRKTLYGQIRRELGGIFRELARQKECEIMEGHLMLDHVHMLISVPPKYAVAQVMGSSRARARSILRECMPGEDATSSGSTSGREATGCRRWARTRRPCVATSRNKRKKTNASNRWN